MKYIGEIGLMAWKKQLKDISKNPLKIWTLAESALLAGLN